MWTWVERRKIAAEDGLRRTPTWISYIQAHEIIKRNCTDANEGPFMMASEDETLLFQIKIMIVVMPVEQHSAAELVSGVHMALCGESRG